MASLKSQLFEKISEIPSEFQARARAGFAVASGLPADRLKEIASGFIEDIQAGIGDADEVAKSAGISKTEASQLLTAYAMTFGLATEVPMSAEEFMEHGRDKLFTEADKEAAALVARVAVESRETVRRSLERASLANETLPALNALDISVDLRLKFEDEQIKDAVPVAVLHIDTDVRPEIWVQVPLKQLRRVAERLNQVVKQLELAEKLYDEKLKS